MTGSLHESFNFIFDLSWIDTNAMCHYILGFKYKGHDTLGSVEILFSEDASVKCIYTLTEERIIQLEEEGGDNGNAIWSDINSEQNDRRFANYIFRCIFPNEYFIFRLKVPKSPIDNYPALVQIMAWRRIGDKPLSGPTLTKVNGAYIRHSGEMS